MEPADPAEVDGGHSAAGNPISPREGESEPKFLSTPAGGRSTPARSGGARRVSGAEAVYGSDCPARGVRTIRLGSVATPRRFDSAFRGGESRALAEILRA